MSHLSVPTQKRLILLAGRSYPELAQEVADNLGIPLSPTLAYDFANGEIFVRFQESVRGTDAFVLQSHTTPITVNEASGRRCRSMPSLPANPTTRSSDLGLEIPVPISCSAPDLHRPS